jgi:hypothetical protein
MGQLHRSTRVSLLGAVALVSSLALPVAVRAGATPSAAAPGTVFFSIRVAPDYTTSHAIFASGSELTCQSNCARLFRSTDGGHTWLRATAAGWTNGDTWPALSSRGPLLVSAGRSAVQESWDGGEHFSTVGVPAGSIDVTSAGGAARAIIVDSSDHWRRVNLADLGVQDVPGASGTLQFGTGLFTGLVPDAGGIAGLAFGKDITTGLPALERCTATWRCDAPSDIEASSDGVLVQPSIAFAADRTVFARSVQHGTLFRSTDAGHSFAPVTVAPAANTGVISTVQGLAFSADFDAAAPRGSAYAAVVGVTQAANGPATVIGGVYFSRNGGASWQRLGASSELDHGATALAVTPDGHIVAAFLDAQARAAGLLCTADGGTWQASCPSSGPQVSGASGPGLASGVPGNDAQSRAHAAGTKAPAADTRGGRDAGGVARGEQPASTSHGAHALGGRGVILVVAFAVLLGSGVFQLRRHRRRATLPGPGPKG